MAGPWIGAWPVGVSKGARDYCRASGKLSEISVTVENGLSGMSVATVPEWASRSGAWTRHRSPGGRSISRPWAATKKSLFEFLWVDAPSWFVPSMNSSDGAGTSGVVCSGWSRSAWDRHSFSSRSRGFPECWVSCGVAVHVLEVGTAAGWLFLPRLHHTPNVMIVTRTTSATIRLLGDRGVWDVASGAAERLLSVARLLVVADSCLPVSR